MPPSWPPQCRQPWPCRSAVSRQSGNAELGIVMMSNRGHTLAALAVQVSSEQAERDCRAGSLSSRGRR